MNIHVARSERSICSPSPCLVCEPSRTLDHRSMSGIVQSAAKYNSAWRRHPFKLTLVLMQLILISQDRISRNLGKKGGEGGIRLAEKEAQGFDFDDRHCSSNKNKISEGLSAVGLIKVF
ncbi:hypothetical protein ElyMa_003460500 [Elysia marginata]|uniref:Uncharacterized protein n=1 Tax=Elysia marginata TaxID=1093978 RepID=A0AAV4E9E5_9GAST|nr:hypothetical protein ElyMa_003460500 [Elysia marginata]